MQQTANGFFYICLGDETLEACQKMAKRFDCSIGEVIAESIEQMSRRLDSFDSNGSSSIKNLGGG